MLKNSEKEASPQFLDFDELENLYEFNSIFKPTTTKEI